MRGRKWGLTAKGGRTGVGGGEQKPEGGEGTGATDENEVPEQRAGERGVMEEARRKRRPQRSGGRGGRGRPQRFPRPGKGSRRRGRPARRAHLGGRGRRAVERGGERGRELAGRELAARGAVLRGGGGGGGCPRPRGRGHGRGGCRGAARAGARAPYSPRGCLRTEGRRGLRGRTCHRGGSGEAGGCPAPPPPPRGLPRPRPSCRRRRLLPGPHDDDTPSPPPPRLSGPGAAAAPGLRRRAGGYLGLAGPRPGLREPEEPEECMAGGGAGGRRRRRSRAPLRLRRGPRPVPGGAETRSPGPGRVRRGGAEGRREEAAGAETAVEPPPERPLMKAPRPPPASRIPLVRGSGPWGCLVPRPAGPRRAQFPGRGRLRRVW